MRSHAAAAHPLARHHTRRRSGRNLFAMLSDRFLLLPIGAVVALVWANAAPESYFRFSAPLAFVVNEIGMALFFALITQEVVEALMPGGALHSWRRWSVALAGAAGGIVGSAAVFLALVHYNYESLLAAGWPVVCAVDIAAVYYTLKTMLPRSGALPFALLLGISTDAFGVLVVP